MPPCTGCGRDNPAEARFCSFCGTPLEAREAGPPLELRKTVTAVFCDLVGSTSLGERLDSESLRQVMRRYFDAMREALERHGGHIEKFIGDAVMAVFGVPAVHEDDALRAVRAAADMQAALPSLNEELERRWGARLVTRIGVNTGEAVAGEPAQGEELVVVGDVLNVAARLEQAAAPGEILIGASTYGLVRDAVEVEAVEPLALKGKSEPVPAFRLVAVRQAAARARRRGPAIVGRERELDRLEAAFRRCVAEAKCQLATLVGDAGVGKSRLTDEFTRALGDQATVVRGRCLPYGEGITFWPVAEIVKDAARVDERDSRDQARAKLHALLAGDDDATPIADRVAAAVGLAEGPFQADETFWAIRRFLEILAADRPLVVVFDDLQWGEARFLDLVEYVARGHAILLLCMARPELRETRPAIAGGAAGVALEPLADEASRRLIENFFEGAELPERVVHGVGLAAQGNPLFVEELLRMLVDDGVLRRRNGCWDAVEDLGSVSVPPTVEALLAARIDRLERGEQAVIERAAVVGQEFSGDAVAELSPEAARAALDDHLEALVRKDLVRRVDGDGYRFAHILVRDVAYGRLLKESRSELHERFAAWTERRAGDRLGEYEEIVGYHLAQAHGYREALAPLDDRGRGLGQRAARHLAAAGRRALARGDMPAATSLLERASALPAEGRERLETRLDLVTALGQAGALVRADEVIGDALAASAELGDDRLEQRALLARAWLRTLNDPSLDVGELLDVAAHAIPVFEAAGDDAGLATAWHLIGQAHFTACRCAASAEALEHALAHAGRAGDRGREAEILLGIMTSWYFGPTSSAEAIARCEEVLGQSRGQPWIEASALNFLAGLTAMRGRFPEARDLYARGGAAGSKFGAKLGMAAMALYSGEVEVLAADHGAAERDLRRGREILVEIGETGLLAYLAALLAEAVCAQGRSEEAERFTEESAAAAAEGDVFSQAAWRATRAKALAQRGLLAQAEELAREAVSLAGQGDALNLRGDATVALAEVLGAAGRWEEAAAAYEAARELYDRKGNLVAAARAEEAGRRPPT